jgi:hypothetical protein
MCGLPGADRILATLDLRMPQGLDWIHPRGAHGGVEAEDDAHED